jgi:carbon storage regulator
MMLVLRRKPAETILIGSSIRLTVVAIRGNRVRLGITAPPEIPIRREEIGPEAAEFGALAARPSTLEAEP